MNDLTPLVPPRRTFIRRAAGVLTIGLTAFATARSSAQPIAQSGQPDWPGTLRGRHRQLVDAYTINDGAPLDFAHTFLATNGALGANAATATAVVVLRHSAFPIALKDDIWRKYKIGEAFKVTDPETKAPASRNPFWRAKRGTPPADDVSVERLLANGVVFGACNVALLFQSKMLAGNAGVSPSDAAKEWAANLIPGIALLPSGVWGVNRAQETGCTYCSGG
jgi:intracellular sulfur oxidation DsrE/DsrF family protein